MIWKLLTGASAIAAILLAVPAVRHLRELPPPPPPTVRMQLVVPADVTLGSGAEVLDAAISPDGDTVAFVATQQGATAIWTESLSSGAIQRLAGTDGAVMPAWTADGTGLLFFSGGMLNQLTVSSGDVRRLADAPVPGGVAPTNAGEVLFVGESTGVVKRLSHGMISDATALAAGDVGHSFPFVDRSGRMIYVAQRTGGVRVVRLSADGVTSELTETSGHAELHGTLLLHVRDEVLLAQHVDDTGTRLIGRSTPLATGVGRSDRGRAYFTSSARVTLWARAVPRASELAWFSRSGEKLATVTEPGDYWQVRLAPNGREAAVTALDPLLRTLDVMVVPLAAPGNTRRLSLAIGPDTDPVWSPGGASIVYRSAQSGPGALMERASALSTDAESLVLKKPVDVTPSDWRGRQILFHAPAAGGSGTRNIFVLDRTSGEERPVTEPGFNRWNGRWSRDGRWIAYSSDEGGQSEVYVQAWPGGTPRVRATFGGGQRPQWGQNGALYFLRGESVMRTTLTGSRPPIVATPQPLLTVRGLRDFAVTDDERILAIAAAPDDTVADAGLILDWQTSVPPPAPPIIR